MAVNLREIVDELLPGLQAVLGMPLYQTTWAGLFVPQAPAIWIPTLTLPQVALAGAAAAIVKNPEVTRRFWQGWLNA